MALNLNPPNFSGVQNSVGGLNITNPGALGLQAYQMKAAQAEAMRKMALEKLMQERALKQQAEMALMQRNSEQQRLGLLANQQNQDRALEREKMGLLSSQRAAELGLDKEKLAQQALLAREGYSLDREKMALQGQMHQDELGVKREEIDARLQEMGLKQLLADKKEKIQEKGAFAASSLVALKGAKTPAEANMITNAFVQDAIDRGYISKEEGKQFSKLPISLRENYLVAQTINAKLGAQVKALQEKQGNDSDVSIKVGPDGTVEYNSNLTKANLSKNQEDIKNKDLALQQLDQIEKGYKPEYFTYKNSADEALSSFAQKSKGFPVLDTVAETLASVTTGKDVKERSSFLEEKKGYMDKVNQLFNAYKKEITGSAAGEKEMENLRKSFINGDLSPSEFLGSLTQVKDRYKSESNYSKDAINKGVNTTTSNDRARLKTMGFSDEKITEFFKKKGIKE